MAVCSAVRLPSISSRVPGSRDGLAKQFGVKSRGLDLGGGMTEGELVVRILASIGTIRCENTDQ